MSTRFLKSPSFKISNSNSSDLPYRLTRTYFKHFRNVKAEIRHQYSGYKPKSLTVNLLALKYQLSLIRQDPILGILETIHSFKVTINISNTSDFPIKFIGTNNDSPFWISRQSALNGVFSQNLSSEIEWNRIRFSKNFLGFIWSKSEDSRGESRSNIQKINRGLKLIDNLEISKNTSKELKYFQVSDCKVVSALFCISESKLSYLDESNISDEIAWPTNLLFETSNGNALLVRSEMTTASIEKAALLGSNSSWFHFLVEILPRYLRAREISGNDLSDRELLVRGELPTTITEIINLIGFQKVRTLYDGELVLVRDLYMVTESRYSNVTNMIERQSDLELVRNFLLAQNSTVINYEKVYLKRAKNLFRPLSNRSKMETQLARLGFVTVKLEELSTFEQIAIFQGARIVVAESGAALTNIIFMRQKSRVLEIHPGNDQAGLWGSLANVFNVGLEVIYGKQNRIRNLFFGLGSYRLSMRELELKLDDLVRNL